VLEAQYTRLPRAKRKMPNKLENVIRKTGKVTVGPLARPIIEIIGKLLDQKLDQRLTPLSKRVDTLDSNRRISQQILFQQYQLLRKLGLPLPRLRDTGFRVYSQSDEDGLLLYVFSLIGMTNRICVDIASGVPDGANSTNLIRNWGFTGFLFEANEDKVREATWFFEILDTNVYLSKITPGMVIAENVNVLLRSSGAAGEIDLFSLDMDGIDYWVWKALDAIHPRVVVCEFTPVWDSDKSVTIPYDPEFTRPHANYWGASLAAFVKLGNQKGYRLVGSNRYGYNAIFIRQGLGEEVLPEVSPDQCLNEFSAKKWKEKRFADFPDTARYPWIEV
jgi:hypothetical protein